MSEPDLSAILSDLAAGRIDPAEAARRIDAARAAAGFAPGSGSAPGAAPPPPEPEPEPSGPTGVKGTDRISVRSVGRRVRILGDPAVATVSVEGEHLLRRQGAVLEVVAEGEVGPNLDGFSILRPPRSIDDLRSIGLGKGLVIRVNPAIEVDAEITAGSLAVEAVPFLGRVRVTAGGATLRGVRRVGDALVQAGTATVEGPIGVGRSRVKVESGSLTLVLARGANVTVRGEAQVGRIQWPGEVGTVDEVTIGNGSARLDLEVVMGAAQVRREEATA